MPSMVIFENCPSGQRKILETDLLLANQILTTQSFNKLKNLHLLDSFSF